MATFDDLRASRDKLARRVAELKAALAYGEMLLAQAEYRLRVQNISPEVVLLLQELNRELKADNDEAEAKQGKEA